MTVQDLRFTKTHEWARLDSPSGVVTVGITAFAVEQLGDIVFLELPAAGASVKQDGIFGVVESVKAAVDLCSPVSGEVVDVNQELTGKFELLAEDPYGSAWMIKVKPSDVRELESLMPADKYDAYVKDQHH